MRHNKKEYQVKIIEQVAIVDAGSDGKAIAKQDGLVFFVEGAVPGDLVDVQVFKKKKSFLECKVVKIHQPSAIRVTPFCKHFGICGGCKWQNMQYTSQLYYKQKQVYDALTRLTKVVLPEILPILPSAATQYYRNKLEYTFSNKRWLETAEISEENLNTNALGFHIPKRFDKILDIETCYLQPEPSNSIRLAIKKYAVEHGLSFFDLRAQAGFLRNLIIRTSTTGDLMVIVVFYLEDEKERIALMEFISKSFPEISALLYVINAKGNDTISDLPVHSYKGNAFIMEEMEGLKFKIGAKSFYQTNSLQAYELYKITREFAGLEGTELVYDLYTGTGTIANFVASKARKVIGIEYIADAIEDAKENSTYNNITNTEFYAGDMKDVLNTSFIAAHGRPDVVITDPPRAGMHEDVVKRLLEMEAPKIVYVSCNPATQARDLTLLDEKYEVVKVQPVDMFPHTHHVENVVLLHLK
jgi:23S rRNA (uracil1939-C5)-methyltransferase